jgi:hypothetical protein
MLQNLKLSWPLLGASAAFATALLGGYSYYIHAVVIPAEVLAEQQRELAVKLRDAAVQRDVEAAGNAILNTLALMQTTQAMTPMALPDTTSASGVATTYAEPAPVAQPIPPAAPQMVPAANTGYYYANPAPVPVVSSPIYNPPEPAAVPAAPVEAPGIVTVNVTPPPPLNEAMPQVLTAGYYWAPGYWSYNQGRFNWTRGQVKPTPAAYISSSSVYVATNWAYVNGAYTLIPGHWNNPPANSIPSNTLPGAAPLIPAVAASTRSGSRPGGG